MVYITQKVGECLMTTSNKKCAKIFVIFNFILFASVQIYSMITDLLAGVQSYFALVLILLWLILSLAVWKVIDMYDRKRIRDINLSFLFLNIFCAIGTFVPKESIYFSILICFGIIIMIGITIALYKRYAKKSINYSAKFK